MTKTISRRALMITAGLGCLAFTTLAVAAPGDMHRRGIGRMIERIDADGSGTVSFEEFSKRGDRAFDVADSDDDGIISAEEREVAREEMKARMERRLEARGDGRGRGRGHARGRGEEGRGEEFRQRMEEREAERLAELDTDENGVVSRAEHDAMQKTRFAKLDTDGSGDVTPAEFKAAREEMRGKRGEREQRN